MSIDFLCELIQFLYLTSREKDGRKYLRRIRINLCFVLWKSQCWLFL